MSRLPERRCGRLIEHGPHTHRARRIPRVTSPLVTYQCPGKEAAEPTRDEKRSIAQATVHFFDLGAV